MDAIIYSVLPMPIPICNLIITYTNCIEQIYTTDGLQYKYNNKLYTCDNRRTICIINNTLYIIKRDIYNEYLLRINNRYTYLFPIKCFAIKYSNGLVCEHYDNIAIYDVSLINDSFVLIERCPKLSINGSKILLLYADNQYIITRNIEPCGLNIYDSNLNLIKTIATEDRVDCVIIYKNKLSYCIDYKRFPIVI